MSVYTITPDLLRSIGEEDGIYLTDILFVFTSRNNPFKVAIDNNGVIIDYYKSVENNAETIAFWLNLMSFKPSPFELINVDLSNIDCEETKFMKVCKETLNQRKLVLYTYQNLVNFKCENGTVIFEDTVINILDRDIARNELTPTITMGDTIINSQVAKDNSNINKSKN